jgi:UDPglucose 6-dehydrogenase
VSNISVIGTGYVGLVTGSCFADLGNNVWCIDIDEHRISELNSNRLPIYEPSLEEVVARNRAAGRLHFTMSYEEGLQKADFVFVAVGTPSDDNGSADMSQVRSAVQMVGRFLRPNAVIINKSTVPVGTGDWVTDALSQSVPEGVSFAVVSNPEFLREGSAVVDFMEPDRIIIGCQDRPAAQRVAELYQPLNAPVMITDIRTAEMIKYASNAILATRISFINEISAICERLGADVKQVAQGMGYDKRIGPHFLYAGIGFGGSCFPKDVRALTYMAEQADCHPQLLRAVMDINFDQRRLFVDKIRNALGTLEGATIGVWGLSFKPNTDDMRDAPAVDIIKMLAAQGASVRAYDPAAIERAKALVPMAIFCQDVYQVAAGCDAVLLLTEWNEFKQVDMQAVRDSMKQPVLIDGRNLYDPDEMVKLGFRYWGVGRACPAVPATYEDSVY